MHTTLAAQLAQLELGHLAIGHDERSASTDIPESEAIEQTLGAVWSDLLALFPDTALEEDAEEIAWGLVNVFHRAAAKPNAQVDRATDEIRCLLASADGSEVHSSELEKQIARAQAAEAAMFGLEAFREAAAALHVNETGSSWRPATGSRLNRSATLTSAVVEGRDFLRAQRAATARQCRRERPSSLPAAGSRSPAPRTRRAPPTASVKPSIGCESTWSKWCSSTAGIRGGSTALPPPGPSGARLRR